MQIYAIGKETALQIKIAVCDDDIEICSHIENILMAILTHKFSKYEVDIFYSGEKLCKEMDRTKYDLVFLDIELPQMNGVEIGKYIREIKKDNITQIVYVSSMQEYAMELFKVRPLDFLLKPLDEEKIGNVIDVYINLNGGMNDIFHYRKGYSENKIELYKIMYFIRNNRKISMFTTDGEETFYESLEAVYERVKNYGFLFIHKSYLVNYRFIQTIQYDRVIMADNEELSISQSRRKIIRDMYNELEEE
jgi:DNA-binding LytR/AlgR family response regulator